MQTPSIGSPAPAFDLPATGGARLTLADLEGRKVVLWFYPRDATPGCTNEARDFTARSDAFEAAGATIVGVSRDPIASHEKFRVKEGMPFALLADEDGTLCRAYGVLKNKKMYGREFEGIERSTFLIDEAGVLRREWRAVKVPGHVDEVLDAVKGLDSSP